MTTRIIVRLLLTSLLSLACSLGVIAADFRSPFRNHGTLLRLSGGVAIDDREQIVDPEEAARQLEAKGVRFVVLNRDTASAELSAFVEERVALQELARGEHRTVYEVDSDAAAWNRTAGVPAR